MTHSPRAIAQQFWREQAAKRLEHGDQLVAHYALRCSCRNCGRIINWDSPEGLPLTVGECCGLRYTLHPRVVTVLIDSIAEQPILPPMPGSSYSDPNAELGSLPSGDKPG